MKRVESGCLGATISAELPKMAASMEQRIGKADINRILLSCVCLLLLLEDEVKHPG